MRYCMRKFVCKLNGMDFNWILTLCYLLNAFIGIMVPIGVDWPNNVDVMRMIITLPNLLWFVIFIRNILSIEYTLYSKIIHVDVSKTLKSARGLKAVFSSQSAGQDAKSL